VNERNPNFKYLYKDGYIGLAWAYWALAILEAGLLACPPWKINLPWQTR